MPKGGAQVVTPGDIGTTDPATDHVTFLRMANETPQAALDEFVRAVRTPLEGGRADPNVAAAFAAGWHAADARSSAADVDANADDEDAKRTLELARSMLKADIARLKEQLTAAEQPIGEVTDHIDRLDVAGGRLAAAKEIDNRLGAQLMAADFRLGKAFLLACRIAALREFARPATFERHAFAEALVAEHDGLQRWLQQLATALPPNAAHSVRDSLNMWANAVTTNERRGRSRCRRQLEGAPPRARAPAGRGVAHAALGREGGPRHARAPGLRRRGGRRGQRAAGGHPPRAGAVLVAAPDRPAAAGRAGSR